MSTQHTNVITENDVEEQETGARTSSAKKNYLAIVAALVLLYILWGTTYLGMREALHSFPPFLLAGIRALVAGILLFAILRARGASMPTRKEWLGAAIVGVLLLVGGNAQVNVAEQWVSSGLAAVAVGAVPLWTALFAGLFGRWPNRFEWCGLALGFAGLILLNAGHGMTATNPLGIIVLLLAPICWSFGSIVSQRVSQPKGLMAPAVQLLCGGIILIPLGLATGERITAVPTAASIGWMVFLIVGGSMVAFTAYAYLLSHVRPALATSYAYVNPLVAVCLGIWLAGEKMNLVGFIAMLIILSGVVLVTTLGRPHGH
jgi:drug/metabolite transporter (DMT)-like permease